LRILRRAQRSDGGTRTLLPTRRRIGRQQGGRRPPAAGHGGPLRGRCMETGRGASLTMLSMMEIELEIRSMDRA
jgi:hypothetical protein